MDNRLTRTTMVLAAAVTLVGCAEPRDLPASAQTACTGCHGSRKDPAPPSGVWTRTDDGGVGAHQAHLKGSSALANAVACEECHQVPKEVDAPGHIDTPLPAEVVFGKLASAGGVKASYDAAKRSCTVYCHGVTLSGGAATKPDWLKAGGVTCSSCHGAPPGDGHPSSKSCEGCHSQVVDSKGQIKDPSLHINGKVELDVNVSCSACHGSAAGPAPPVDTSGNSASSERGVGAHQAHLKVTANHGVMPCDECHVVPKAITDKGHIDALPAEVTFGKLAKGDLRSTPAGLKPSWDATALTCSNTYCHGLDGGGIPTPSWTKPQQLACGSCHGLPPATTLGGGSHAASSLSGCATCHGSVIDSSGAIIAPLKHVNGKVDF